MHTDKKMSRVLWWIAAIMVTVIAMFFGVGASALIGGEIVGTAASTSTPSSLVFKPEIPYAETNFAADPNWKAVWGSALTDASNFLNVSTNASTTSALVLLNDSENWSNYKFTATLDWPKGQIFGIIARYVDDDNYLICNFIQESPGVVNIRLMEYRNGNPRILRAEDDTNFSAEGRTNITASISVRDTSAICSFNEHTISNEGEENALTVPYRGGVGFTAWDPAINNAGIIVKSVTVGDN